MSIVKLSDITTNLDNKRKPLNGEDRKRISIEKKYPYCGANNIMDFVDEYLFDEEILCIAEDGGKWGTDEVCSYIMNEKCWVNNHAHVIKVNDKNSTDIRYLKYWLNHKNLNNLITGAIVKKLTQKSLNNIVIDIPSIDEQRKICIKLDSIQNLIDIKKEQINKLNDLIKSQFVEMFGDLLSSDIKYDRYKLAEVANIGSSKRIYANEYVTEGIPFYRSKEIIELGHNKKTSVELFITEKRYEEVKEKYGVPQKGDILITAVGTIGETWVVDNDKPFYYKDGNLLLISLKKEMSELFFKYSLDILVEDFKKKNISGSSYGALTIEKFKNMNIVYPPVELQNKFAQIVEQIDKQKFEFEKSLKKLEELQASLMQEYFG